MRRPSFQFYHGDWRSNAKLRRCDHKQRGIWLEVMCLMADEDDFGVLRWPLADIANAVPCRIAELRVLVEREVLKGADAGETCKALIYRPRHAGKDGEPVVLIPEQPGPIWYSSRMVRDSYIASQRGKGTRFGVPPTEPPTRRTGDGPSSASSSATALNQKQKDEVGLAPDAASARKNGHDHGKTRELRVQAIELLSFLNEKAGRNYQPVPANIDMIVARLKEGATLGDCRAVIAKKTREWLHDEHMTEYLRPATLFNRTKFAQYVGEIAPAGAPS